jgi:hypothetical protein
MTPSTRGELNNEMVDKALETNDYSELMLLSHDALKFLIWILSVSIISAFMRCVGGTMLGSAIA